MVLYVVLSIFGILYNYFYTSYINSNILLHNHNFITIVHEIF